MKVFPKIEVRGCECVRGEGVFLAYRVLNILMKATPENRQHEIAYLVDHRCISTAGSSSSSIKERGEIQRGLQSINAWCKWCHTNTKQLENVTKK